MDEQEKSKNLDALNDIRKQINGCFGIVDFKWGYPLDEERAKEIRIKAFENNISLNDMQDIILGFLFRSGSSFEHINTESKKALDFFARKIK